MRLRRYSRYPMLLLLMMVFGVPLSWAQSGSTLETTVTGNTITTLPLSHPTGIAVPVLNSEECI